jgi:ElaA protein
MPDLQIKSARIDDIAPTTLYRLLKLRSDVFVVEQGCPYSDMDGRDLEPDALQIWIENGDIVLASLRVMREPDGTSRIGRVCTAKEGRGQGLAKRLMNFGADQCTGNIVLDAQSHLREWYEALDYQTVGDEFLEDDIPHVPMKLVRYQP